MKGVSQLVSQHRLLGVVGQLEQVETGGGGGKAATCFFFLDVEKAFEDRAHCVTRVLGNRKEQGEKYMHLCGHTFRDNYVGMCLNIYINIYVYGYIIEGSRPEWCISIIYHA